MTIERNYRRLVESYMLHKNGCIIVINLRTNCCLAYRIQRSTEIIIAAKISGILLVNSLDDYCNEFFIFRASSTVF